MEAQFTSDKAGNETADRKSVRSSRRRAWLITSNIAASLVVLVAGCSSWNSGSNWSGKSASPNSSLAFGEEGQELDRARKHISQTARQADLPEQFVSEARIGMAEVERSLASARAIDVESRANLREQQAKIIAHRQEAASREQIALAEAENRRKQANAEQSKLYASVSARQREVDSTVQLDYQVLLLPIVLLRGTTSRCGELVAPSARQGQQTLRHISCLDHYLLAC